MWVNGSFCTAGPDDDVMMNMYHSKPFLYKFFHMSQSELRTGVPVVDPAIVGCGYLDYIGDLSKTLIKLVS
jgi:hypothetical protein